MVNIDVRFPIPHQHSKEAMLNSIASHYQASSRPPILQSPPFPYISCKLCSPLYVCVCVQDPLPHTSRWTFLVDLSRGYNLAISFAHLIYRNIYIHICAALCTCMVTMCACVYLRTRAGGIIANCHPKNSCARIERRRVVCGWHQRRCDAAART